MKKITVYLMKIRNANTGYPINIVMQSREAIEKFKADADNDKRYSTSDITEVEAESVRLDNTVYAINTFDNVGMRETINVTLPDMTYNEFISRWL